MEFQFYATGAIAAPTTASLHHIRPGDKVPRRIFGMAGDTRIDPTSREDCLAVAAQHRILPIAMFGIVSVFHFSHHCKQFGINCSFVSEFLLCDN